MAELRSLKRRAGIAEETVRIKSDMASLFWSTGGLGVTILSRTRDPRFIHRNDIAHA